MRDPNFNIEELIEYLQGTCISLSEGLEFIWPGMYEEDLTEQELIEKDDRIFLCDECEWWCAVDEMSEQEDQVCKDCESLSCD